MIFLHFSFSLNFQVFDSCPQAIFTAEQTRDVSEYAIANWRIATIETMTGDMCKCSVGVLIWTAQGYSPLKVLSLNRKR